jgi:hypothetical protein
MYPKILTFILIITLGTILNGFAQDLSSRTFADLKLRNIGPATMSGRIVDLAVLESDPYTMYVASATGGVWKTTNNGVTFNPVFENEATHSVGDIALHQIYPDFVWVGTGERANRQSSSWGDGVYKSNDGGKTWKNVGLKDSHHIGRIVLHPEDTNTVYVAAMGHLWGPNEERGLYKTTDGGASWQRILQVDENTGVVDVAMDPSNPNILYAATYQRRRRPFGFNGGALEALCISPQMGGKPGENWRTVCLPAIREELVSPFTEKILTSFIYAWNKGSSIMHLRPTIAEKQVFIVQKTRVKAGRSWATGTRGPCMQAKFWWIPATVSAFI